MRAKIIATAAACTFALIAQTSLANAIAFTTSTSFAAGTTGLSLENYGAYAAGTSISNGGTLGVLSYTFTTGAGLGGIVTNLFNSTSGESLAARQVAGPLTSSDFFFSGESFTVTLPIPVTAIGIFANVNLPVSFQITTSSGTASGAYTAYEFSTFDFLGFASSTPFTSATFTATGSSFNIPEIEWGALTAVPEPTTLALFGAGLAGLGAMRRRRKAKA